MGYETKLIIGNLTDMKGMENKECFWVKTIAEIDLCKSVFFDTYIDKELNTTKVYIYGSDGDTEISKDRYGSHLLAIGPKYVLKMMQDAHKESKYRRYAAAIPLLKSLITSFKKENLTCILYGY